MENKKTCGICTFEKYEGRIGIGSSMIRGHWLVNHWDEAEIFVQGRKYDTVIYQKAYWVEHAKLFKGVKILDLCDPDWMHWGYRVREMIDVVDCVVAATEKLAEYLRRFTNKPVYYVPDRVDLDAFPYKKVHIGDAKNAVWYGYSHNFDIARAAVFHLVKNKIGLITVSDKPITLTEEERKKINFEYIKWDNSNWKNDVMKGDFSINPVSDNKKWKFKSNNKTLNSWALGLPVAQSPDDIKKFIKKENRIEEMKKRNKELKEKWDVKISILELKDIIDEIARSKKSK